MSSMPPEGSAYVQWFHDGNVWKYMTWHGIRTLKFPADIWNYQEIIFERGIDYVLETGTRHGGSALFFAETLAARNSPGFVVSCDVDAASRQVASHPRINFLVGDSGSPEMVAKALALLPEKRSPILLILDSDHSRDHVIRELRAWIPPLKRGDYVIVEDTIVNGHPLRPEHGPGPWEALEEFHKESPGLLLHDPVREEKFGATFAPRGYLVRT